MIVGSERDAQQLPAPIKDALVRQVVMFPDASSDGIAPNAPGENIIWMADALREVDARQALPTPPGAGDIATIIYTSGTTGTPKGIPYTHQQCLIAVDSILSAFPSFNSTDVAVCILPLSHLFQRIINLCTIAMSGHSYFINDPKTFQADIQHINPTILVGVPMLFEKMHENVEQKLSVIPFQLGRLLPLSWVRHKLLGRRMRVMITGSAPISSSILQFYRKLGVPFFEAYGMSENIIPMAMNTLELHKDEAVGKTFAENAVHIQEDGEIYVSGPGVFAGYWDEDNRALFTDDGFFKTGDIGHLDDDGFLYLTGRKSDLIKTSTGRRIMPLKIKETLGDVTGVEHALIFGNGRKHLVAMLQCKAKDSIDLAQLKHTIAAMNASLADYEKIQDVLLVTDIFSPEKGHLTSSLKLRSNHIEKLYLNDIDNLYQSISTALAGDITIQYSSNLHG